MPLLLGLRKLKTIFMNKNTVAVGRCEQAASETAPNCKRLCRELGLISQPTDYQKSILTYHSQRCAVSGKSVSHRAVAQCTAPPNPLFGGFSEETGLWLEGQAGCWTEVICFYMLNSTSVIYTSRRGHHCCSWEVRANCERNGPQLHTFVSRAGSELATYRLPKKRLVLSPTEVRSFRKIRELYNTIKIRANAQKISIRVTKKMLYSHFF